MSPTNGPESLAPAGQKPDAANKGVSPGGWVLLATIVALSLAMSGLVVLPQIKGSDSLFFTAPVQILLGSVVFLATVMLVVIVFARLGLYDRESPLALPEGSVRALLALVLLIIFVIFANIIYGQMSKDVLVERSYSNLSQEQVEGLPGDVSTQIASTNAPDRSTAPTSPRGRATKVRLWGNRS